MRKYTSFIERQLVRFGAMSVPQMEFACKKCSQVTIYRTLKDLTKGYLIERVTHVDGDQYLFVPSRNLIERVLGENQERSTGVSQNQLSHTVLVTDSILTLSQYSSVTGVATEHEFVPSEIQKFCHNRRPDGIIQISNERGTFCLALEVERTQKNEGRTNEIVEKYQRTFLSGMPCKGVLIVVSTSAIKEMYQANISKLPKELQSRFVVSMQDGLERLNPKNFGVIQSDMQKSLQKTVSFFHGTPTFSVMKSTSKFKKNNNKDPYIDGQSIV